MTNEVSELKNQLEAAKAAVSDSLQETDEVRFCVLGNSFVVSHL